MSQAGDVREPRHQLVARREAQGLSQEKLAEAVGVTPNTIYRWEAGESKPSANQRRPLAAALDVPLARLDRILKNEDGEAQAGSVRPLMPHWLSAYVAMEQSATRIHAYQPHLVHGLLETRDYARAIFRDGGDARQTAERVEQLVELRTARAGALHREGDPLELALILGEAALRTAVGDGPTMRAQLDHLADMAELPNVVVQVLTFDRGPHRGTNGAFTMLAFPWATETRPSTIYSDSEMGRAIFIESPHDIALYVALYDGLRSLALPPEESIEFIRRLAKEHRRA